MTRRLALPIGLLASLVMCSSSLSRVADDMLWPLNFGHSKQSVTEPPASRGEGPYDAFQKGVVYTITTDLMPSFLSLDEREHEPCLVNVTTKYMSEADFLAGLSRSRSMRYRGEIHVSGAYSSRSAVVKEFVTSRAYDVEAMYRTIGLEGNTRCGN